MAINNSEKDAIEWVDKHNLCSFEVGGCWLKPDDYFFVLDTCHNLNIVVWLLKHNAELTKAGCNIGSNTWQPYRRNILGEK